MNPPVPTCTNTPIHIARLEEELQNHPDPCFVSSLLENLRSGFHTGVEYCPQESHECKNLLSCRGNHAFIEQTLAEEVDKGYIIGPYYPNPPPELVPYRVSPLGVVESKYSKKKRLIVDLSSPRDNPQHPSINALIDKSQYRVSYTTVDKAVQKIKQFGQCLVV